MDGNSSSAPILGMRHFQAMLDFFCMTVFFICRLHIAVAVVAMTNAKRTNPDFPEFDWSTKEISYILSSFFWGYILTQFIGGLLCRRFGAVSCMGVAILANAILLAITPWSVFWGGWKALIANRFTMGLLQGVLFPCIFQHLAKWTPTKERNLIIPVSLSGSDLGVVLAMALPGPIAASSLGWPGISYVSAGFCIVWCIFWFSFGSNNAAESKFIKEREKVYIESSLDLGTDFHKQKIPVPWKAILTSMPFLSVTLARCASTWVVSTMHAQTPAYMNGVLHMDIKNNSLYSTLPFAFSWFMTYVYVAIAGVIQRKNLLTLTQIRKTFNTCAYWISAALLLVLGCLDEENKNWAIILLTLCSGLNAGGIIGSRFNIIDLSPNHAGVLTGIVNTFDNCMPIFTPLFVGVIISDTSNRLEWQIVFAVAAAISFFGNLIYLIFGTAHTQPWDAPDYIAHKDGAAA